MNNIFKNIIKILTKREQKKFRNLVAFDVAISVLDISFLVALLLVIRFYTDPESASWPFFLPGTIRDPSNLFIISIFFVLFSIKNFIAFIIIKNQQKFLYGVAARLSAKQLQHYQDGYYADYIKTDSSVHIRNISQLPIEFGHYVLGGLQQIISQSILIFITLVAIFIYNPVLLPLLFLILGLPLILIGAIMKKKLIQLRQSAKTASEKTLQYVREALLGFIESNVYHKKKFFSHRYESSQTRFNEFLSEQQAIQNVPSRLIEIFAILGLLSIIAIHSFASHTAGVQLVTIGAFMAAAYKIIPGIVKIVNSAGQIKTYAFTITHLLEKRNVLTAAENASKQNIPIECISFANVSFQYNGSAVLEKLSFGLKKGTMTGLTGKSGKGKTTIINLLLGFLDNNYGTININDVPTTAEDRKLYWKNISYVKQQPFVIYDSLAKNITLDEGLHDSNLLSDAIAATGLEQLCHAIDGTGLNVIFENGKNISGGQRQRLTIARALYKNADLIILDEPFSELDKSSEKHLINSLKTLSDRGKMILLVTHDKESLSFCDTIISLDEK